MWTFSQNKYVMTSIIQLVLQNFRTNWNKQTSYLLIKKISQCFLKKIIDLSVPNVSKIYERRLYDQIRTYFEHIFSRYQCGFRKGYSTQQCLLAIIEKWKKFVDNRVVFGALLTDLSKAFDCIPHDLIIAKLEACGFHIDALKLVHKYLMHIARGRIYFMVSYRDPYSVLYYSIYIYVTYSTFWKT